MNRKKATIITTAAAVAGLAVGGLAVGHRVVTHDTAAPASQEKQYAPCKDIQRPSDPQNLIGNHWPTASGCALMALSDQLPPEQAQWVVDAASHIDATQLSMASVVLYVETPPEELGSDAPMSPDEARTVIQHEAEHLDRQLHGDGMRLLGFTGPGLPDKPDYIVVPIDQARDHLG